MATKKSQRIGIWIITIVMTVGTIGLFGVMMLDGTNQEIDKTRIQQMAADYQADVNAQAVKLSSKYFTEFNKYASYPAAFNKDEVQGLKTSDLKVGDGAKLTDQSTFTAYYIGWNPSGEVFDSSIDGTTLKAPFTASPGGVISGWTEGVAGMKVGGVRVLTIPSDKAYGEAGSGDKIPANTPLKFIVMVIPTPDPIVPPQALVQYYQSGGR